jgi:hypothetical protein
VSTVTVTAAATAAAAAATTGAATLAVGKGSNNVGRGGAAGNNNNNNNNFGKGGAAGNNNKGGNTNSGGNANKGGNTNKGGNNAGAGNAAGMFAFGCPPRAFVLSLRSGNNNNNKGSSTSSVTAASSTAAAASSSSAASNNSNDPQSSTTLDPKVIATGFENNGQDQPEAGQVASLTSSNNFINFCLTVPNLPITNGLQVKTGSCNPAPMGIIAATTAMPSCKFQFPQNFATIKANTNFTVKMAINNLETGHFVNANENYFSAPQQVNAQGQVQGHSHVVIEAISSFTQTTATDPTRFAFFKGLNDAAQGGVLTADVTGGLPTGIYRIASINSAANHQPVLVAIAQHGSLDDMTYVCPLSLSLLQLDLTIFLQFEVTADGTPSSSNPGAAAGNNSAAGAAAAQTSAAASSQKSAAAGGAAAAAAKGGNGGNKAGNGGNKGGNFGNKGGKN